MRCSSIYTSTVEAHCIRVEERKSAQATHQFRAVQGAGSRKAEVLCGTAAEKTNTYKEWNREWREKAVCCVEDRQGKWKSGKASRTSTVRQVFFESSAVLTLLMLLTSTATQSEYSDVTGRRLWNRSVVVLLGAKQCVCVHPMMQYMLTGANKRNEDAPFGGSDVSKKRAIALIWIAN